MSKPVFFIGGVLIVLVAIAGFFLPLSARNGVEQTSMEVISPVLRMIDWFKGTGGKVQDSFKTIEELQAEVVRLQHENNRLGTLNQVLEGLGAENNRLREMLGFQKESSFKLLAARVIERDPSNWWNAVIINRGWQDDKSLAADQPVVSPRGIVGKTGTVGRYTTRVILLVDENCKISAVTEGSRSRGIVQGATSINGGDPICKMTFVSREADLAVGERVFTTGLGGTFPANLLIGTVSEAPPLSTERNFGLYREAVVQPTVDLNNLEEVFVLIGVK